MEHRLYQTSDFGGRSIIHRLSARRCKCKGTAISSSAARAKETSHPLCPHAAKALVLAGECGGGEGRGLRYDGAERRVASETPPVGAGPPIRPPSIHQRWLQRFLSSTRAEPRARRVCVALVDRALQQSWPDGCPFPLAAPGGESVDDTSTSEVACLVEPVFHLVEVQSCDITHFASFRFAAPRDEDDGWGLVVRAGAALCRPDHAGSARRSRPSLAALLTGERERSSVGEPVALLYAHTHKLVSSRVFVLFARLAAAQMQLTHRLLALASHLHLLVPVLHSSGIRGEEEELCGWLEELREEGAAREGTAQSGGSGGEWKVMDEDGLVRIAQILSEQQAGLVHLTKILKGDLADIHVVLKGGGRQGEEGDGEELWGRG
ncbi:hypothetical protein DFH08DRAFT_997324 [Mycena albidolilacea]|uniref:Uncharacterized protein n=1 Tax=Mycena albidolilacea TaxID=1033008 RepID=A0AAD7EV03_9AGAR|nr:hypothetical protein DFH08DRAFT_997324 [Mycena albidolilacea]